MSKNLPSADNYPYAVFEDAADPIIIEDLNGVMLDANAEAIRSYGFSKEELVGKPLASIVVPANHYDQAMDLLRHCLASVANYALEVNAGGDAVIASSFIDGINDNQTSSTIRGISLTGEASLTVVDTVIDVRGASSGTVAAAGIASGGACLATRILRSELEVIGQTDATGVQLGCTDESSASSVLDGSTIVVSAATFARGVQMSSRGELKVVSTTQSMRATRTTRPARATVLPHPSHGWRSTSPTRASPISIFSYELFGGWEPFGQVPDR